jgi:hypothetical protein
VATEPEKPLLVIVGLLAVVRPLVEKALGERATLKSILMKKDGGAVLEPPPKVAASTLERYVEELSTYANVTIVLLPYAKIPQEVRDSAKALEELGARVLRPTPNSAPWPARPPKFDQTFQQQLAKAIITIAEVAIPGERTLSSAEEDVAYELIRGLVSHRKMGENNHSSEDDLWKSRGNNLEPGARDRIEKSLLVAGILGRKKNKSIGGTGWVYWVADVPAARTRFPALEPYFAQ